eukprot:COSAG06_NODE_7913_length_2335_cov_5.675431_2_plen_145_part_00
MDGFEGAFADQHLAVWFGSSVSAGPEATGTAESVRALLVNHTGPCGDFGGNPTPDACRIDAPLRVLGGAFSQIFSLAEVASGSEAGFVTVLAPAGSAAEARAIVTTASAKFSGDGDAHKVDVSLPTLGRRVSLSADGSWAAHKL